MAEPLRLFILAGEASGDRIGADLVQRLRALTPLTLSGVGGAELVAEGLKSLYPMENLSVMGFGDVLRRLPLLLWRMRQTARAILRTRPDVVVLIDSQVFSEQVAKRVRRGGGTMPMLLYVAPSVWAWRPERAPGLKPLFDEVLAVLPFEPRVMAELGGPPTSYVGHPALSRFGFRAEQPARGPLLLLPGSRGGELRRHLPVMREVATALAGHPKISGFVLPTLPRLVAELRAEVAGWSEKVEVISGFAGVPAIAAVAVSGTVTLELALCGVPMAVVYVPDRGQVKRGRKLQAVPRIGLPNIVLGRELVPELILATEPPEAGVVIAALRKLLDEPDVMVMQRAGFVELRDLMSKGAPEAPLTDAAQRVISRV